MDYALLKNCGVIGIKDIPILDMDGLGRLAERLCAEGGRLISYFSSAGRLYALFADDDGGRVFAASAALEGLGSYKSMTPAIPSFHMFERELWEDTGIMPEGHPWLKPVRYGRDRRDKRAFMENYPFYRITGSEIHEVAVGPVHAGVIEPGHFRFNCAGEKVLHLEIQLGYQHRGLEKMMGAGLDISKSARLVHSAERIAGDTAVGHAVACASALETLGSNKIPVRARIIRAVALELERIGCHLGDLSALSGDVAYLPGNASFGAIRTMVINSSLALCGSRFGMGLVCPGGVNFDIERELAFRLISTLSKVKELFELSSEVLFSSPGVLSRLQRTGIVKRDEALACGLVGPAARASGVALDVRVDHPSGIYKYYPLHKITLDTGDVFARAYIRHVEIRQSLDFIFEQLQNMREGNIQRVNEKAFAPSSLAVSMTEGWRGEIVHAAVTDAKGGICRYKIKDPSFNNWFGLALAVRKNAISDFPLCNKSFNLSYCGNDL